MYNIELLDYEEFDFSFIEEKKLTECIIYNIDSLNYGKTEKMNIDLDNILEARFFNEKSELKIIRGENSFDIIYLEDNDSVNEEVSYFREYLLDKKIEEYGRIKVKNYVGYDEDGQAYLKYMRPYSFEKEVK